MWKVAIAGDGRQYYYHEITKQTSWEKPADFDEQAAGNPVAAQPAGTGVWKEATNAADGRTYYYNTVTSETTWERPASLQTQTPVSVTPGGFEDRQLARRDNFRDVAPAARGGFEGGRSGGPWEQRNEGGSGFRGATAKHDESEFSTPAEAEAAFFKFLRAKDVKYDSDWRDVIRTLGREKGYRAFKDPRERKQAFEKFCAEEKVAQKSREQERKTKQRESFKNMLKLHDEIKYYTRWKNAVPLIERELIFKSVQDDDERKQMFREYVAELQKRHAQEEGEVRERALNELSSLLHTLVISSDIKWQDALQTIESNQRFANDKTLRSLSKSDILKTYEAHIRVIDAERNDTKQRQKQNQYRNQRQARDGFKELLQEQLKAGNLRATSKWKDFHPHIAEDKRYQALLGMPGSSPIELFWDVIDDEDRRLRSKRNDAYDVLEAREFEMRADTEFAEFEGLMRRDNRTRDVSDHDLVSIFEKLIEKVKRREQEERLLAEKDFHNAVDALRSAIKHLRPAIHSDDKYEDVASKIESLPEARGLEEDARRMAFDKHIKRAQEKAVDREKDRARRDRDRDPRSRRSYDDDRERLRTHSPEMDAYEEDRRKAQAVRERQYRKASFGLSPPPRDRRDDRGDRGDRDRRDRYGSVYERERKERELERERSYISRADPRDRGKVSTLDYGDEDTGDSVPGSIRKRRESEVSTSSKRDNKVSNCLSANNDHTDQPKRARRSEPPTSANVDKEEVALQSGSEEGEIEEV